MALTFDYQTNDISASSGSITFDGSAVTIDASQNLMVGTTTYNGPANATTGDYGAALWSSGLIAAGTNASEALVLNRMGSDGDIAVFKRSGTTVSSIGIQGTGFYIDGEAEHAGIRFGGSAVVPRHNNADSNNYVNLGDSSTRFKDAYIGGGVYLGGTVAANLLDSYEEGTFTTTTSSAGYTLAAQHSVYVKIGGLVHINAYLSFSAVNGSSNSSCVLGGLPFTSSNFNGGLYYTGVGREDSTAGDIFVVQQTRGTTTWAFNSMDGVSNNSNQPIVTGRNYSLSITYRA